MTTSRSALALALVLALAACSPTQEPSMTQDEIVEQNVTQRAAVQDLADQGVEALQSVTPDLTQTERTLTVGHDWSSCDDELWSTGVAPERVNWTFNRGFVIDTEDDVRDRALSAAEAFLAAHDDAWSLDHDSTTDTQRRVKVRSADYVVVFTATLYEDTAGFTVKATSPCLPAPTDLHTRWPGRM